MNPTEFYLWLNGYLEALESEGITEEEFNYLQDEEIVSLTEAFVKDSTKFTPPSKCIHTISATEFGDNKIEAIQTDFVINKMIH